MPTSSYMPDVVVEIAWDGGYRVPMADWTWTDVSDYVELGENVSINWGRGDERSNADANTLSLTLDNSDGRFTAGRTLSPYYPDVVLYKPIRILATPVDGSESPRFTGYITAWPTEWEDTSAYAKAAVTASSRLHRLGLNAALRSLVEETILTDSPVAYYPLGEPEGSTQANDVSGNGAAPLVMTSAGHADAADVVFGSAIGPPTDDLTAATFSPLPIVGGKYLSGLSSTLIPAEYTVEAFYLRDGVPASPEVIFAWQGDGGLAYVGPGPPVPTDGAIHHVAFSFDGTDDHTYIDGVEVATGVAIALDPGLTFVVGGTNVPGAGTLTGVVAHVAIYDTDLAPARIAAHAAAGLTGYAGDTTDERLETYAELGGIPAAEVAAETGSTTMAHVDTTGSNVVDMLRLTEATEGGVLFDGRDGLLTLHNREHRYDRASALTLDMAKHEVESDYSPRLDPSALANDITAANVGNTVSARAKDDASILANGVATASYTTASESKDEPLNLASWAKLRFSTPRSRVPSLSVDALAQVGKTVTCADVMAVGVGDKVTVGGHPSQAAYSLVDYFVEGGSEVYGPESLVLTWNVSPSSPDDLALIVGDVTQGVVGTNYVAL